MKSGKYQAKGGKVIDLFERISERGDEIDFFFKSSIVNVLTDE